MKGILDSMRFTPTQNVPLARDVTPNPVSRAVEHLRAYLTGEDHQLEDLNTVVAALNLADRMQLNRR